VPDSSTYDSAAVAVPVPVGTFFLRIGQRQSQGQGQWGSIGDSSAERGGIKRKGSGVVSMEYNKRGILLIGSPNSCFCFQLCQAMVGCWIPNHNNRKQGGTRTPKNTNISKLTTKPRDICEYIQPKKVNNTTNI